MFKSKYILDGDFTPIVFPETLAHSDVARNMGMLGRVIGAGFCYIEDNKYVCYGESVSLNVKSRGDEDSKRLNRLLGCSSDY